MNDNSEQIFKRATELDARGLVSEASECYKKRVTLRGDKHQMFLSFMALGRIHKGAKRPRSAHSCFAAAYQEMPILEPLLELSLLCIEARQWRQAFLYLESAAALNGPEDHNSRAYDYLRWHLLGIVAFYVQEYECGKMACEKALLAGATDLEKQNNIDNAKFYST